MRLSLVVIPAAALLFASCSNAELAPEPTLLEREVAAQGRSLPEGSASLWTTSELLPRHGDEAHEMHHEDSKMAEMPEHEHEQSHAHAGGHVHKISHEPWKVINETDILLSHQPNPLSYYEHDGGEEGRRGVLIVHIVFMSLAFFVLLPLALFLKAASSHLAIIPQAGFLASSVFGLLFGTIYNKSTPELYPGSSHSKLGWFVMMLVLALNVYEVGVFALKVKRWFSAGNKISEMTFNSDSEMHEAKDEESAPLVHSPVPMDDTAVEDSTEVNWSEMHPRLHQLTTQLSGRSSSTLSDDTLFDPSAHDTHRPASSVRSRLLKAWSIAHTILDRSLVVFGYVEVISGIAVYSGSCRAEYGNGCLAHSIKGSIFVWYGLLTFARYVGAYAEYGWAWNRRPKSSSSAWSAEFTESFVIFLYGSTNTWLERLGAHDSSYSIKDIQHISIAVMFWFAGGLGMLLESRKVRNWLSQTSIIASGRPAREVAEPSSASFSFNPFPALCIGITGIAMAAHAQTYQFQVDIHALWGQLLGAFSLFRLLTYFFLFLRPPASILPSRPPTEALASFCLTAGGIVFILSIEQITFAAMRSDFDDMMAFLNITVAFVCIVFTWVIALFAMKGWALARQQPAESKSSSHHHRSVSMAAQDRSREGKARRMANFA